MSGFATGLFSIPEGMAYAQLAGVDPVFGLYSGMVASFVAALTTGTILMISTLTSAIALTMGSVLDEAGIGSDALPRALFTITFLTGAVMLVMGLLRMGGLVDFVSNAVMTGFVLGASLLILIGELGDFSGYDPSGSNKLTETIDWIANLGSWDLTTTLVAVVTVAIVVVLKLVPATERFSSVIALIVVSAGVTLIGPESVAVVRDIAEIPNSLPMPMLPDFSLVPDLALGSVSVALVALVQGAGISTAYPNPDGSSSSQNRDFIGEGLGNVAGSFFQSLPTGGSLSRTGISVDAGATSRWGGVFGAAWLAVLVLLFGSLAESVPLAVIAGLLVVIAVELIMKRVPSVLLVIRTSKASTAAMLVTFVGALFIPLQWTIFGGAVLSLLLYVGRRHRTSGAIALERVGERRWTEVEVPATVRDGDIVVVSYDGSGFFAEVPRITEMLPDVAHSTRGVVILLIRDLPDANSTFLKMLRLYHDEVTRAGSRFILAGVRPAVLSTLDRTGVTEMIGAENVYPVRDVVGDALEAAYADASAFLPTDRIVGVDEVEDPDHEDPG